MDINIGKCLNNKIVIKLLDDEYEIDCSLNTHDMKVYNGEKVSQRLKDSFLGIIFEKIMDSYPDAELSRNDLTYMTDTEIVNAIDAFIENDPKLREYYKNTNLELQPWERFLIAYKSYTIDVMRDAKKGINNLAKQVCAVYTSINNNLIEAISTLINTFKSYLSPDIPDADKDDIIENYKKWGEYGWSIDPSASLDAYENAPSNIADANEIMDLFYTNEQIKTLTDELKSHEINHQDLEEAISGFNSKNYKSCALILFGLIDSKVIIQQPQSSRKNMYRPTGKKALVNVIGKKNNNESIWFMKLRLYNLESCANVFFQNAHDFNNEPDVINRNFISHGMNKRAVQKRDCIQLFLLLINTLWTI